MKGKWKRKTYTGGWGCFWVLQEDCCEVAAEVTKASTEIYLDPRTGKPWKSMKAAREWFDEVTK